MTFPITRGTEVTIQYQNISEPATITKLKETLNKNTGEIINGKPRSVGDSVAALVTIQTQRPICIELFSVSKQFGRFTLRDKGQTIATGVVFKLLKRKPIKNK